MFHHEYDSVTGLPLYSFWALPGTLDTAAAWRGLKWTWSGDALLAALWADGNDTLDNVYANRAALTYAANPRTSRRCSFSRSAPS